MKSGFYTGLEDNGLMEVAVRNVTTNNPFPEIQAEMGRLMNARPDGIICGSSEVAKDYLGLLGKLRPDMIIIPENFRIAGRNFASTVLALINGDSPQDHQNTYFPERFHLVRIWLNLLMWGFKLQMC